MDPASMTLGLWIWRHGTPGERAWILADPALVAACQAAPSMFDILRAEAATFEADPTQGTADRISAFFQRMGAASAPGTEAHNACVADLAEKLHAGVVVAMGYPSPRRHDDAPVVIKRHQMPEHSSLAASTYKRGTLVFEDIRLLPRDKALRLQAEWDAARARKAVPPNPAPAPKTPGPEGVQRRIEAAFAAMERDGAINRDASMSAHFPEVRRRLIAAHPEAGYSNIAPSDETIRKTFRDLFKANSKT